MDARHQTKTGLCSCRARAFTLNESELLIHPLWEKVGTTPTGVYRDSESWRFHGQNLLPTVPSVLQVAARLPVSSITFVAAMALDTINQAVART